MKRMDWLTLKSGSDVRGTAVGEGAVLTDEVALALGAAFVRKLCAEKGKKASEITISLGRDSRISGPALLAAAAEGIRKAGAVAIDFGMCTTPAMFMSTITDGFRTDGAIMITASHHPWNKNGLKFFTEKGGLEGNEISELLRDAQAPHDELHEEGEISQIPFLPVYMKQLADRIRKGLGTTDQQPLKGLQVAVDAGNGAGGFYAKLMEQLGASTEGSQFLEPDGRFPNHIPNPENTDAIQSLQAAVTASGADVGVIFDADCDRAAIVDGDGKAINRNRLIALISAILLEEKKGQTIVTDSVTSSGLADFIREHGGRHYRFKRGYRNVIDEAIRLNREGESCPLAIETSGHAALRENHFLDDGMYLVTVLIVKAMELKRGGKMLGSLIADLKDPLESSEIRLDLLESDFRKRGEEIMNSLLAYADGDESWHVAPDNREGVRIGFDLGGQKDAGWFLLRLSVHDPVMPLNAESDVAGGVKQMLLALYNVLKGTDGIDLTALKQAVEG
jgi:phosphomannomutase